MLKYISIISLLISTTLCSAQTCLMSLLTNTGVRVDNIDHADLSININTLSISATSNLTVEFTVSNIHSSLSAGMGLPISFYSGDPTLSNAILLGLFIAPDTFAAGQNRTYTTVLDLTGLTFSSFDLFAVASDDGTTPRPYNLSGNGLNYPDECNFINNKASFTTSVPLPIELLDFGVEVTNNDATFKWHTATEQNNEGFYVQLTDDAHFGNFEALGFVAGQGNSNQEIAYQFEKHNLSPRQYYARLRQVDFDGTESYSNLVAFKINDMTPRMFPSVIGASNSTELNISIPYKGFWSIQIIDMLGRTQQVLLNNTWQDEAVITYTLNASNLVAGMYMVMIKDEGAHVHWVEKLIKNE